MTDPTLPDVIIATLGTVAVAAINAIVLLMISTRRKVEQNTRGLAAVDDKVNGRMSELIDLLSSARDHLIDGTPFHPDEIPAVVAAVGPPPPPPVTLVFGRSSTSSAATSTTGEELPPPAPVLEAAAAPELPPADAQALDLDGTATTATPPDPATSTTPPPEGNTP